MELKRAVLNTQELELLVLLGRWILIGRLIKDTFNWFSRTLILVLVTDIGSLEIGFNNLCDTGF